MNTNNRRWLSSMITLLTVIFSPAMAMAELTDQQKKMINQLDQLDQLDHLEFTAQTEKADTCIRARDYSCAEKKITKAAKYAISSKDKNTLRLAKLSLAAERRREKEELEAAAMEQARQIRQKEEQRRIAQARQRQREEDAEASDFQWGKAGLGIGVGLLAGGGMSSEAKIKYIEGIVKDSMPGQEGLSNTTANANAYADKQKKLKIIADQQSRKQLLQGIAEETANNERLLKAARESHQPKTPAVEQRVARADAQRNARANAAKSQSALPKYLPQVVTIPSFNQVCPPGSSPARQANGEYVTNPPTAYCVNDPQSTSGQGTAQEHRNGSAAGRVGSAGSAVGQSTTTGDLAKTVAESDGCYIPRRDPECVVVEQTRWSGEQFFVTYRNNCEARVYIKSCILKKDGSVSCGADGLRQGASTSFDAYSAMSPGIYRFKYTGITKASMDWVCGNRDPVYKAQDLQREILAQ